MNSALPRKGSCSRCAATLDAHDLCCPVCGRLTSPLEPEVVAPVVRCGGCGASAAFDPQKNVLACAFCGSAYAVEQPRDPVDPVDWFVPFTVSQDEAFAAVSHWLRHQDILRPKDLLQSSALESVRPIWWATWVIDTDCRIFYTADVNIAPAPTIWRPISGNWTTSFRGLVVSATRGLKKAETDWLLQQIVLDDVRSEPIGPPHATAEVIELQRSGAWQQIFESIRNQAVSAVGSAGVLPGSRHKNLKVSPLLSAVETKRVGFPVYVLAYRYDGELFRVLVDGRDKQRVFGDAPFSTAKLTLVILVIVVILAGVIAAIW